MMTFISIEYSEPKILTWNSHLIIHHHILDSPVNFAEQYSSLIVWWFVITVTFLRSNYV